MYVHELTKTAQGNANVLLAIKNQKYLEAIKELRAATNCTLRDAKDAIDILRGETYSDLKMFTQREVNETIVRNLFQRTFVTDAEKKAILATIPWVLG
jgi:ribosomal protein L7/L12